VVVRRCFYREVVVVLDLVLDPAQWWQIWLVVVLRVLCSPDLVDSGGFCGGIGGYGEVLYGLG
jgi:hypothetical protein